MTAYNIVTAVCFCLLTFEVLYILIKYFIGDRESRIAFLRSFKKGKFAFVFVWAMPLFYIAQLYAGQSPFAGFFNALTQSASLILLRYETASIAPLISVNTFYAVTVYYCFTLVALNALLFTLSLTGQRVWLFFSKAAATLSKTPRVVIFGCNVNAEEIYSSDTGSKKLIIGRGMSAEEGYKLYVKKMTYLACRNYSRPVKKIFKDVARGKKYTVIVNTGDDVENIKICRDFSNGILSKDFNEKSLFDNLHVYVFGDPKYEEVFQTVSSKACGCISYVNKYLRSAAIFVEEYPLTRFMDGRQIDYSTSLIKEGVDINVCMIGFGKVNRHLFLTSVANNQFLKAGERGVELKPVKYYIFDRGMPANNKNLNHSYYRYKNERESFNEADYLPLPDLPAEETYFNLDVNDRNFYSSVKKIITNGPLDANFVIIAFGSDLENIDMAQKLLQKRREWQANFTVFVKVHSLKKDDIFWGEDDCYFIANDREVFNLSNITDYAITRMARLRNEIYNLEYAITNDTPSPDREFILENRQKSEREWFTAKSYLERESNVYACLSIKSKLNLMGLDYVPESAPGEALSEEQYLKIYAGDDLPDVDFYNLSADGKKVVHYTLDFKNSRRKTMAEHEHFRWNSFMISKGMVPASLKEIKFETRDGTLHGRHTNGKNYQMRRHGNLTTFDGLVRFRKLVAGRDGVAEETADVIKYDYQLLDDAWWFLNKTGNKIIKRADLK